VRWIEEQLKAVSLGDAPAAAAPGGLTQGALAVAKFTLDDNWYRAYIEKVGGRRELGGDRLGAPYTAGRRNRHKLHQPHPPPIYHTPRLQLTHPSTRQRTPPTRRKRTRRSTPLSPATRYSSSTTATASASPATGSSPATRRWRRCRRSPRRRSWRTCGCALGLRVCVGGGGGGLCLLDGRRGLGLGRTA